MTNLKKTPKAADIHVGSRVRMARTMIRMSQETLGEKLGITFQQIQKYEKGTNRIGSSRLMEISIALGKPVGWFFQGLDDAGQAKDNRLEQAFQTPHGAHMLATFASATPEQQKLMSALASAVVKSEISTSAMS